MVAIKLMGLLLTFYLFIAIEVLGQNFYPVRYGKRDENDSRGEQNLREYKRFDKSHNQEALIDRKFKFLLSGGRYGKRDFPAETYSQGEKEIARSELQKKQEHTEKIRIPIRKNKFMMGSRFGKRMEALKLDDGDAGINFEDLKCIYQTHNDFYPCLNGLEPRDESRSMDSNYLNEFLQ